MAEWAVTPTDICIAGKFDLDNKFKLDPIDEKAEPASQEEWKAKPLEFEFSLKELATIKKCLLSAVKKGVLFPNKWTAELIKEFIGEEP